MATWPVLFSLLIILILGNPVRNHAQILHDSLRLITTPAHPDLYLTQVNDLVQGEDGLLWLGTDRGLARFDGISVDFIEIEDEAGNLLKNYTVRKLIKSRYIDRMFYLCTDANGLIEYNTLSGISRSHRMQEEETTSLRGNSIISLIEESDGNFWISTDAFCLSHFNRESGIFTHYEPAPSTPGVETGLLGEMVRSPINDEQLWLASRFGLYRFDKIRKDFTLFPFPERYEEHLTTQYLELFADKQEKVLWLGRYTDGLWRYDPATGQAIDTGAIFSRRVTPDRNFVRSIFPYNEGTILISSEGDGFAEFNRKDGSLREVFTSTTGLQMTNLVVEVRAFLRDAMGNLWLGTKTGLYRFAPQQKGSQFLLYEDWLRPYITALEAESPDRIKQNWLRADLFSRDGKQLYLGTLYGDGLIIYDVGMDNFRVVRYRSGVNYSNNDVWMDALCEDSSGKIWIGSDRGLLSYEMPLDSIREERLNRPEIDDGHVTALAYSEGLLYIGTRSDGIFCFDPTAGKLVAVAPGSQLNLLPRQEIYKLRFDQQERLWIGTNAGLFIYAPQQQQFLPFKEHTGGGVWLSELGVYDIIETAEGNIFISTLGDGLVSYDPTERRWKNYRSNNFEQNLMGEMVLAPNGNIIIASINQHLEFNPTLAYDQFPVIRDFETSASIERSLIAFPDGRTWSSELRGISEYRTHTSEEQEVAIPLYLKKALISGEERYTVSRLNAAGRMDLSYQDHTFTLEPGALNFTLDPKLYFFQKLEGIDDDWVEVPANSRITYSNVASGQYRFLYRARDQSGRWTKDIGSFEVVIHPPWWRTTLAYSGYLLLLAGGLLFGRRQIIQREQLRNNLKLEQLEREKVQEIDQLRARFYANISHEFRTPLTLIKAPLEDLLTSRRDDTDRRAFFQMHQNTERLLHLVQQLLDLSRLESGVLELQSNAVPVYTLLRQLGGSFQSLADQKHLDLCIETPDVPLPLLVDRDKFEKIVLNLLSNAVKFAPENGWVRMTAEYDQQLKIGVGNNGPPIPHEEQARIFQRFYQAADTRHQGAGIGLALVRELVQLHGGTIRVESNEANGTWFWVTLPLQPAIDSIAIPEPSTVYSIENMPAPVKPLTSKTEPSSNTPEAPLVLLVEDHDEVRAYIREKLQHSYRIIEAEDGEVGLKKALKALPDLILSDLMMPKMDGLQLCQSIKEDHRTDHIPFILLTAKADVDSRLEGLRTGADDYLAKPFNNRELQLRIDNLIEQRRRLRKRFAQSMTLEPEALPLKSIEQEFIERAIRVVEEQMDNADFKVTDFGKALLLSRTHLHRKLKNLTGYGATDFIRHIRLQRAAQLLAAKADTVTQIAFEVGFSSQSYFTKCFKAKFGMSPTAFQENEDAETV